MIKLAYNHKIHFKYCLILIYFTLSLSGSTIKAQNNGIVELSQSLVGDLKVVAPTAIKLKPGFRASEGLYFHATIGPSNNSNITYQNDPEPESQQPSPQNDRNYIWTRTSLVAGITTLDKTTFKNTGEIMEEIKYFDGLGRDLQDVSMMASPGRDDVILPYSYDNAGRKNKDYIPYINTTSTQQNGQYDQNFVNNQLTFIGVTFPNEGTNGYTEYRYEISPLNRIIETSAPGSVWTLHNGRRTFLSYCVNDVNISSWRFDGTNYIVITYEPNQLYVNNTQDENRNMSREYKDKNNKLILTEEVCGNETYRTYYIYNDLDLLCCVVPPKAQSPDDNSLCFYYGYDSKKRMTYKQLPGGSGEYMIYDKRDRLVMKQDKNMYMNNTLFQWWLYSYDNFNRLVMTSIYTHTIKLTPLQMQSKYNTYVTNINENITGNYSTNHGYTGNVCQALGGTAEVYAVNYYDNYDFAPTGYAFDNTNGIVNVRQKITNTKTLLTGVKVKNIVTIPNEYTFNDWMLSVSYYDYKYKVIQTVSDNQSIGGKDIISNNYSFTSLVNKTKTHHTAFNNDMEILEEFGYDHTGRLIHHTIKLPECEKVLLSTNEYDNLGQLATKKIHATETSSGVYSNYLQKTDYLYNIRGWLKQINNPDDLNNNGEQDIFGLKLYYQNDMHGLNIPQYNGNISAMLWKNSLQNDKFAYSYTYDNVNRLKTSSFARNDGNGWTSDNSYAENMNYDANGNITTLTRYADNQQMIDNLTYSYDGNRVSSITDAVGGDIPFITDYKGNGTNPVYYSYDYNNNTIADNSRGISLLNYNFFNKPIQIDFGNSGKIFYIYDGNGNKLGKKVVSGSNNLIGALRYLGNFVYDWDGTLQYILNSEGRLVPDGNTFRFEYFMKDHLGNTRATYAAAAPGLPQVMGYQHYYPFGMQLEALCHISETDLKNNYLYNGKELQEDYDLNWYDYGARMYDPIIGRWHAVDPLADERANTTFYNFCNNNPINRIDPDGAWDTDFDPWYQMDIGGGNFQYQFFDSPPSDNWSYFGQTITCTDLEGNTKYGDQFGSWHDFVSLKGVDITANDPYSYSRIFYNNDKGLGPATDLSMPIPDYMSLSFSFNGTVGGGFSLDVINLGYLKNDGIFINSSLKEGMGYDLSLGPTFNYGYYKGSGNPDAGSLNGLGLYQNMGAFGISVGTWQGMSKNKAGELKPEMQWSGGSIGFSLLGSKSIFGGSVGTSLTTSPFYLYRFHK